MKVYYSDRFNISLPPGHRFPGSKYRMLREKLVVDGLVSEEELTQSPLATDTDILRAHAASYVRDIETGDIDPKAMRRIGFPWSPTIAKRARATAGGAIASARAALNQGIAGQLAGGTHHAHFDFGSGYCVYNDFAVAALNLLEEGIVRRVAIIDLDVHQGDGNASILGPRDDTFIFSMHGAKNFPFRKEKSDLDLEVPDDADDEYYLSALNSHIGAVFEFQPDVILYQAGVDPLAEDKLGRMALTHKGLFERDTLVLETCKAHNTPISMAIGGGYADPIELSVEAYANTYRAVRDVYGSV